MGSNPTGPASAQLVPYFLELAKSGYRPQTIASHSSILRYLSKICNISDPESVRIAVMKMQVSAGRKENIVNCYSNFARFIGVSFSRPRYERQDSLPVIPQDQELVDVINTARSIKHSTTLQLMYETGGRVGEITALELKDFDFSRKIVRIRPEKGSRAREVRISDKAVAMVNQLFGRFPENPFPNSSAIKKHLWRTTHLLSKLHSNPRYLQIHAHTFRHYRACRLYWETKDILFVKAFLGHRSITSTMKYLQLVQFEENSNFICKAAKSVNECSELIEAGFDYITEIEGVKLFRKRK